MCIVVADRVFGQNTTSQEVYDVASKPVVKAAMEGVNGIEYFSVLAPKGQFMIHVWG